MARTVDDEDSRRADRDVHPDVQHVQLSVHQQGGRRKLRGGLRLREEGAPAERATAREAGKFLKSEKNSVLENDQNARLSPFPLSSLFPFPLFSLNFFFLLLLLRCCAPTTFRIQRAKPLGPAESSGGSDP